VANFADPKKIEEAARLRSQGVSLRQVSKLTGLHRETIVTHTGRGVVSRSEAMTIYHARRKGMVVEPREFNIIPIARPQRFIPIGAPLPIKRDPTKERFQNHLPLVTMEAKFAIRKMASLYDLKTLEHFGSIGLWNACTRFTGDETTFPSYARLRIRGQIWDEIRNESALPRRMLKAENKPRFDDIGETHLASNLPSPDDLAHFHNILAQVDSVHLTERERQVVEALAHGDRLRDVALAWGVSESRASQTKAVTIQKMADLIRKADL
jgi:RNA polymerase sigma factor FliA